MPIVETAQSQYILGIYVADSRVESPILDASHLLTISENLCRKSRNCGDDKNIT